MKACRIQIIQVKLDKYKALEKYNFTTTVLASYIGSETDTAFIMKIYMKRYNKSTMPVNAEKYSITHLGFELTTSATPPSTALSVTSTNCAIETTPKKIVRIAQLVEVLVNAVLIVY